MDTHTQRDLTEALASRLDGAVKVQEPLAAHTSFRIGGPCDYWVEPRSLEDLRFAVQAARQAACPVFFIGAGSNLLVRDEGFRGMVVSLRHPAFRQITVTGTSLQTGAGASLYQVVQAAQQAGLGGCEFFTGIPATLGGAVAMNAGTSREWLSHILTSVTCLAPDGQIVTYQRDELDFAYRTSPFREEIIVEATLQLQPASREEIAGRVRKYLDYKNATQETTTPCAGCIFRNPPPSLRMSNGDPPGGPNGANGHSAGRLIELVGLKGARVGDAQVSLKHANFIINVNRATYRDVADLIDLIRNRVRVEYGVWLELEVKVV